MTIQVTVQLVHKQGTTLCRRHDLIVPRSCRRYLLLMLVSAVPSYFSAAGQQRFRSVIVTRYILHFTHAQHAGCRTHPQPLCTLVPMNLTFFFSTKPVLSYAINYRTIHQNLRKCTIYVHFYTIKFNKHKKNIHNIRA